VRWVIIEAEQLVLKAVLFCLVPFAALLLLPSVCLANNDKESNSSNIKKLQFKLYYHCPSLGRDFVDGYWGENSNKALKRFQSIYGLTPDGIIGTKTLEALEGKSKNKC
jgi:peptidoglycan hydrolase-like protein with peptidoglycan-binding domain